MLYALEGDSKNPHLVDERAATDYERSKSSQRIPVVIFHVYSNFAEEVRKRDSKLTEDIERDATCPPLGRNVLSVG